jgi:hypothetical protein
MSMSDMISTYDSAEGEVNGDRMVEGNGIAERKIKLIIKNPYCSPD